MTPPVGLVAGTWGRKPADSGSYYWWRPPSVFTANLQNAHLALVDPLDNFDWSTALDGVSGANDDWETAGKALYWWWAAKGRQNISLVAHSHGGQVVAYALAWSIKVNDPMSVAHVVTCGTPVRYEMQPLWSVAKSTIRGAWTHIWTEETGPPSEQMQKLGSLPIDHTFGFRRDMPLATHNIEIVPPTSHHDLMQAKLWNDSDLWRFLS